MNPDTTLRTWILACGQQYGIRKAFEYRWPDALNRQHEIYLTYEVQSYIPDQSGQQKLNTKTGHTVHRKAAQKHMVTCKVDLHNSQDGMYELASFGVAARHSPDIKQIFKDHGSMFSRVEGVFDETKHDDEKTIYHQHMICVFTDNVEISLNEINGVVDVVNVTLEENGITHSISRNELTAAPDSLTVTGTATFTLVGP